MLEYCLPQLALGQHQATIVRWLKQAGDQVVRDEPLLIALSTRAEIALGAPASGIITRLYLAEGEICAIGTLLAHIEPSATTLATEHAQPRIHRRISPVARRMALLNGLDIEQITGSGPAGRIHKHDIVAALKLTAVPQRIVDIPKSTPIRQPHLSVLPWVLTALGTDLSAVTAAIEHKRMHPAWDGLTLSYTTYIVVAAMRALLHYPLLNSAWDTERILLWRYVKLALVKNAQQTVLIHHAQDLNLRGMTRACMQIQYTTSHITSSTFTIVYANNFIGTLPIDTKYHSATLMIGPLTQQALVIGEQGVDQIVIRPTTLLQLWYDARVLDQHYADAFLQQINTELINLTSNHL